MLFTDLLLLTKEVGQHLKVIQDPMFLSQIMIQDFNCDDGTEFHITVVATLVSYIIPCIVLYCNLLYNILDCSVLQCIVLYSIVLYCSVL